MVSLAAGRYLNSRAMMIIASRPNCAFIPMRVFMDPLLLINPRIISQSETNVGVGRMLCRFPH